MLAKWEKINSESNYERSTAFVAQKHHKKLQWAIIFVFSGMLGCWIAQWVFWIGFLKLYSGQG